MTALEEIKKALEGVGPLKVEFTPDCDEFNAIIAPINEDYDGTFFTVIGCGDKQDKLGGFMAIAVNAVPELLSTLESLQRENEALKNLIDGDNCADPDKIDALFGRAEAAEAEVKRVTESRDGYKRGRDSIQAEYDRLRASHSDEIEALTDKIEGLSADLDSAVGVAFNRGAHEWVRMNYPDRFEKLSSHALASTGGEHHAE